MVLAWEGPRRRILAHPWALLAGGDMAVTWGPISSKFVGIDGDRAI